MKAESYKVNPTECSLADLHKRLLVERHKRVHLTRSLEECQVEYETLRRACKAALVELDQASSILKKMEFTLGAHLRLGDHIERIIESFDMVSRVVFDSTASSKDKATVSAICDELARPLGRRLRIQGAVGLPRFRVFPEDCALRIVLSNLNGESLWVSKPLGVIQSSTSPPRWETGPCSAVHSIPLDILTREDRYRLRVDYDTTIVAETQECSLETLRDSSELPLSHNGVVIPDAYLRMCSVISELPCKMPNAQPAARFLEVVILDIRDQGLLCSRDASQEAQAVNIVFSVPAINQLEVLSIPDTPEEEALSVEIDITRLVSSTCEIDISIESGNDSVSTGRVSISVLSHGPSESQKNWESTTCALFSRDEPSGTIALQYRPRQPRSSVLTGDG